MDLIDSSRISFSDWTSGFLDDDEKEEVNEEPSPGVFIFFLSQSVENRGNAFLCLNDGFCVLCVGFDIDIDFDFDPDFDFD
jgi:hypothetical protein